MYKNPTCKACKVVPVNNLECSMKEYGAVDTDPYALNLSTKCSWEISFTHWPHYPGRVVKRKILCPKPTHTACDLTNCPHAYVSFWALMKTTVKSSTLL
jgi:hypothetical protein